MRFVIVSGGKYNKFDWTASGGSEQYHIDLAERLASKGHEVWSFAPTGWDSGYIVHHNMVAWGDINKLQQSLVTMLEGIWVIQRDPNIGLKYNFGNSLVCFAAHDFDYTNKSGILFGEDAWPRYYDYIFTESPSHNSYFKEKYPEHKTKILLSGCGPDLAKLAVVPKVERNPYRLTFSSNPTRGLLNLLKIFWKAHEEVPDLELHVFFGWESMDMAIGAGFNAGNLRWHKSMMEKWMDHPKIKWGGRLPAVTDVWTEYLKTGIWCFPTTFNEIACQTSMEAQIFGAIPIASPRFALADHVRYGIRIEGNPDEDALVRDRFKAAIVELATNHGMQGEIRGPMMEESRKLYDFQRVVDYFDTFGNRYEKQVMGAAQ